MSIYDQRHFDELYAGQIDPWHFRDSAYEAKKYRATVDALPYPRFAKCLELGCSIGVLTQMLAQRCDAIVAVDTSVKALAEARDACIHLPVEFRHAHLPDGEFGGGFDLVIASEVLYYLKPPALTLLAKRVDRIVRAGAVCVAVHWTGDTDYPMTADAAIELFEQEASLKRVSHCRTDRYRLDVWVFPSAP